MSKTTVTHFTEAGEIFTLCRCKNRGSYMLDLRREDGLELLTGTHLKAEAGMGRAEAMKAIQAEVRAAARVLAAASAADATKKQQIEAHLVSACTFLNRHPIPTRCLA